MRNATAQYLDDDIRPDATRDEEIAGEVALHERVMARRVTARDVRRTLATIPGAVPAFGVIRHREEDR